MKKKKSHYGEIDKEFFNLKSKNHRKYKDQQSLKMKKQIQQQNNALQKISQKNIILNLT